MSFRLIAAFAGIVLAYNTAWATPGDPKFKACIDYLLNTQVGNYTGWKTLFAAEGPLRPSSPMSPEEFSFLETLTKRDLADLVTAVNWALKGPTVPFLRGDIHLRLQIVKGSATPNGQSNELSIAFMRHRRLDDQTLSVQPFPPLKFVDSLTLSRFTLRFLDALSKLSMMRKDQREAQIQKKTWSWRGVETPTVMTLDAISRADGTFTLTEFKSVDLSGATFTLDINGLTKISLLANEESALADLSGESGKMAANLLSELEMEMAGLAATTSEQAKAIRREIRLLKQRPHFL